MPNVHVPRDCHSLYVASHAPRPEPLSQVRGTTHCKQPRIRNLARSRVAQGPFQPVLLSRLVHYPRPKVVGLLSAAQGVAKSSVRQACPRVQCRWSSSLDAGQQGARAPPPAPHWPASRSPTHLQSYKAGTQPPSRHYLSLPLPCLTRSTSPPQPPVLSRRLLFNLFLSLHHVRLSHLRTSQFVPLALVVQTQPSPPLQTTRDVTSSPTTGSLSPASCPTTPKTISNGLVPALGLHRQARLHW